MPKYDHHYEIDDTENYRVRLAKSYWQIKERLDSMEAYLRHAEDHPADLTKEDANEVQEFLEVVGTEMERFFLLFVGFSED